MDNGNSQEKMLAHNRIFIEEDKEFSLSELTHLVRSALLSVADIDISKDDIVFSRDDVYFAIVDILGFFNQRIPGNFKVSQPDFQNYIVHYVSDSITKNTAAKGLLLSKAQSAIAIKDSSGKYPIWAVKDDALMELIQSIESKPKAAPTDIIPEKVLDNRAQIAIQIRKREGKLPDWVNDNPRLKEKVQQLIDEEDFEPVDALLRSE